MRSKILWLCSWYPSKSNPYDGDFIQRQADAVSQLHTIDVLHIYNEYGQNKTFTYNTNFRNKNLIEHIYSNNDQGKNIIQKLFRFIKNFIVQTRFIQQNGRPDLIHVHSFSEDNFKTRSFWFKIATKLVIKNSSLLTTVSHSLGDDINHWVIKKPFIVIPNVVDTNIFNFEQTNPKQKFQFIHISNMVALKNVGGIIDATEILWNQRKDFKMVFVGKIDEQFLRIASSKNLLNQVIFFEGEIPYADVSKKIKESESLIIFSDTESQSCVVLESLCCGRPAIVTNVGGVKELIDDKNGFKVKPRETKDLAAKMNEMIDQFHQFNLEEISSNAVKTYSYESVAKQFSSCYQLLLNKKA
jgi:glycosyltransferase involved in cell wall biosynthesis